MRGRKQTVRRVIGRNFIVIKKESPNEGTETCGNFLIIIGYYFSNKKRIPEWGDGN